MDANRKIYPSDVENEKRAFVARYLVRIKGEYSYPHRHCRPFPAPRILSHSIPQATKRAKEG